MSTEPRPGDVIRVSYETTATEAILRNLASPPKDARKLTVEVIGLADDPAHDLVGTVRMTELGPAVRSAVPHAEWQLIQHPLGDGVAACNSYDTTAMQIRVRNGESPVIGVVPGSPAAEKAAEDFANDDKSMKPPCGQHWVAAPSCTIHGALHRCNLADRHSVPMASGRLQHRCACDAYLA